MKIPYIPTNTFPTGVTTSPNIFSASTGSFATSSDQIAESAELPMIIVGIAAAGGSLLLVAIIVTAVIVVISSRKSRKEAENDSGDYRSINGIQLEQPSNEYQSATTLNTSKDHYTPVTVALTGKYHISYLQLTLIKVIGSGVLNFH